MDTRFRAGAGVEFAGGCGGGARGNDGYRSAPGEPPEMLRVRLSVAEKRRFRALARYRGLSLSYAVLRGLRLGCRETVGDE